LDYEPVITTKMSKNWPALTERSLGGQADTSYLSLPGRPITDWIKENTTSADNGKRVPGARGQEDRD